MLQGILRVLHDPPLSGYENMARDEALLEVGKGATLRFFAWDQPTLSLGRYQKVEDLDLAYLREQGVPLVRRPTGGRAILHENEVTLSFFLPGQGTGYPPRFLYGVIREILSRALEDVGVYPDRSTSPGISVSSPACFSLVLPHELSVGGRKVAGIAQVRTKRGNLFEGSLPLSLDRSVFARCFREKDQVYAELVQGFSGLLEIREDLVRERLVERIEARFGECFQEVFLGEWEKEELRRIRELVLLKYAPSSVYHLER